MFRESFIRFLDSSQIAWRICGESCFSFPGNSLRVVLVPVAQWAGTPEYEPGTIYLYEDRWWRSGDLVRARLLSSLGRFRSIYARNCEVRRIKALEAAPFLESCHSYGYAKCAYYYGLFARGEGDAEREMDTGEIIDAGLVAVSAFSEPRRMMRYIGDQGLMMDSYEWVRYASLPDCRIAGGMGKMLKAFIDEVHPVDVMSYADLEWSDGEVYRRLGFEMVGVRPPVEFLVDTDTWERLSVRKLNVDRAYRTTDVERRHTVAVTNMGSYKYVRTLL